MARSGRGRPSSPSPPASSPSDPPSPRIPRPPHPPRALRPPSAPAPSLPESPASWQPPNPPLPRVPGLTTSPGLETLGLSAPRTPGRPAPPELPASSRPRPPQPPACLSPWPLRAAADPGGAGLRRIRRRDWSVRPARPSALGAAALPTTSSGSRPSRPPAPRLRPRRRPRTH